MTLQEHISGLITAIATDIKALFSGKANIDGGNTWSGNQNFGGMYWDDTTNRLGIGTATGVGNVTVVSDATDFQGRLSTSSTGYTQLGFRGTFTDGGSSSFVRLQRTNLPSNGDTKMVTQLYSGGVPKEFLVLGDNNKSYFPNGNVGFGTTSPLSPIHSKNTTDGLTYFGEGVSAGRGIKLHWGTGGDDSVTIERASTTHTGNRGIKISPAGTALHNFQWDGKVGIGTLTPGAPLHVMGEMRLGNLTGIGYSTWLSSDDSTGGTLLYADPQVATAGRAAYVRMFRSTNTSGNVALQIFKGNGTSTANALISGNGSSYVSADNGNFGVGTNNPTTKFQLVGIPTSSVGLPAGGVWNNGGVLNIV